jgi:Ca2+-transporting ATPase
MHDINSPWSLRYEEVLEYLQVSVDKGLDVSEVKKRRRRYGPNRLKARKKKPAFRILVDQFMNLIILLLAVAAALSFTFGQSLEAAAIMVAILLNVAIGFFTELKAVRSMEALHRLSRVKVKVFRNGTTEEVLSDYLVPGDLVLFEAGDIIAADLRTIEASKVKADESTLTGESIPVEKGIDPVESEAPLPDRESMLFKGTSITSGSGKGVVVSIGMKTELGSISEMAEEAETETSPLEKRLRSLGHRLIWITLGIALFIALIGILTGHEVFLIIETSVALAVAAIPEGLPIVATIALARGMWRMARKNALMNQLSAVETLGSTTAVLTDKTGTLTENRMTVKKIDLPGDAENTVRDVEIKDKGGPQNAFVYNEGTFSPSDHNVLAEILTTGVLCNNASLDPNSPDDMERSFGDPMEVALLVAGAKAAIHRDELLKSMPEEKEEAFDNDTKMMATFHRVDKGYKVAVKGAPESVINSCSKIITEENDSRVMSQKEKDKWLDMNGHLASEGLRVLALAIKAVDNPSNPYEDLVFLGLFGLQDPPRDEVADAIKDCREAGIKVVMVTGDQPVTAKHVGISLGLVNDKNAEIFHGESLLGPEKLTQEDRKKVMETVLFARVTPKQKFDLVSLYQEKGEVVAMTGDGVNDAPALKKADIGIAMGQRGTQVAREASDMVLKDDSFNTILTAIGQGRAIFDNIRKFILFLLSGNVGEIMIVAFPMIVGSTLPILPLQILYLNMIGDVFPALALGIGKGDPSKMKEPPRDSKEPILTKRHWMVIVGYGLLIAATVLAAFWLALSGLGMETRHAVSVSFLTLSFARLWHVFNMRDRHSNLINNDVSRNPFVWGALLLCTGLLLAAVYIPGLSMVLKLNHPGFSGWSLIIGMSLVPLVIGQFLKIVRQGI